LWLLDTFSIDFFTNYGMCSIPTETESLGIIIAKANVKNPEPDPMSKLLLEFYNFSFKYSKA